MGFRISSSFILLALCSFSLIQGAPTVVSTDPCTALLKYSDSKAERVPAKDAYACLLSPPFNQTRSANVHEQMKRLSHILSSQAFFNQPKGLPLIVDRVDLNGTLDAIEKKIKSKEYTNDYSFNRDLTELFGGYHDGHTLFYTHCMTVFGSFNHDYPLVSLVPPGEDTPRIYLADKDTGEVGEEVVEIAGEPALDHLMKLVKVMRGPFDAGWIDADTRWNGLFVGRDALAITPGNFASRDLYPGPDFQMKTISGKVLDVHWYVNGPGTFDVPEVWSQLFADTETFVNQWCLVHPTTTDVPKSTPTPTHTEHPWPDYTDVPTDDHTTDDTTDDTWDDDTTDDTTDDTWDDDNWDDDEYDTDGTDYEDLTDDTYIYHTTYEESSKHHGKGIAKGSRKHHNRALSNLNSLTKKVQRRTPADSRQDFDVDWRKILRARDGNTVEDFSHLQLIDMPPVAYPQVQTRMNGTEQTLCFLKAHPEVAVWGFHSFLSRMPADQPPPQAAFFYYWRYYMIENLKLLKQKGIKRLILDMSNNGGGSVVLGMETVRRFFPEAEPFYGIDYRRSPLVDGLLDVNFQSALAGNGSAPFNKLDGTSYESLDEFLNPPVAKRGDYFTKIGRFDQLDISQSEIPGVEFTMKGNPPFAVEDIVILTDGQCGSTCAITVEALASIGVATVVTGGQPSETTPKKMQYIGGIKGYQVLEYSELVVPYSKDTSSVPKEQLQYIIRPVDIKMSARMNFRNSYTPDDHIIPQEFIFQPADAHLWYTKQMINDRTILWNDVVKLTWDDKGKNKLIKSRDQDLANLNELSALGKKIKNTAHLKQPEAGYKGMRNRSHLKKGVLADLKYLASGWLGGWGGKD